MYDMSLERSAAAQLKRLPQTDYVRLAARLKSLQTDPRPRGCRKLSGSEADYRVRVGNWRIVYEVDDGRRVVRVLRIALRKVAYR